MVRLPPTAALRALEAAARHLSYTRAAEELSITQSAVSHQIRHVEQLWGLKLFARRGRRLALTAEGQTLVPIVRDFVERLGEALQDLGSQGERGSLRVSLLQSFAYKWLVPRLGEFTRIHPEIDVWISTSDRYADFGSADVDVAIRLGTGDWPELHVTRLLREYAFPVCSPGFLQRHTPPMAPKDLLRYPLLHKVDDRIGPRWKSWLRAAGVRTHTLPKGPRFQDTSLALQAAIDGQGIVLARSAHVADDLAAGRLIKLFNVYYPAELAYYVVCAKGTEEQTRVAAFRGWLLQEAASSQREFDRVSGAPAAVSHN